MYTDKQTNKQTNRQTENAFYLRRSTGLTNRSAKNMIAECISRRLGVVLITLIPLLGAYHRNLHFFSYIEMVSSVISSKVSSGYVWLGWVWLPENYCPLFRRRPDFVESTETGISTLLRKKENRGPTGRANSAASLG